MLPSKIRALGKRELLSSSLRPGPVRPSISSAAPSTASHLWTFIPALPTPEPKLTCRQALPRVVAGNRRLKETATTAAILDPDVESHPLTPVTLRRRPAEHRGTEPGSTEDPLAAQEPPSGRRLPVF